MFNLSHLILLTLFGLGAYYVMNAIRVKEAALRAVEHRCEQEGVQLLDGSVALKKIRFARNLRGQLRLQRHFHFEFTATGADRNSGYAIFQGSRPVNIELAPHRIQ